MSRRIMDATSKGSSSRTKLDQGSTSSRGSSRSSGEKSYLVNYIVMRCDPPPLTYFVKAKSEKEAEDLVLEYYALSVIKKYDNPSYTGGKLIRRKSDEEVIQLFKRYVGKFDSDESEDSCFEIDGMSFDYEGIEVLEIIPKSKVTPMFNEEYKY